MEFHITDYGSPKIIAEHMDKSAVMARDIAPVLRIISFDMMRITDINFVSEGHRGGGSWRQLAASTVRRKGHSQILVETGRLQRSVTEPDAPYQILKISREDMVFGTRRPRAYVHQYGRLDGSIPARPFLRYIPEDETRWRGMIAEYIVEPFKRGTRIIP